MTKKALRKYLLMVFFSSIWLLVILIYYEGRGSDDNPLLVQPDSIAVSSSIPDSVYVGGMPVGIYLQTRGVMVVGTGTVTDVDGVSRDPAGGMLEAGDYILAVNGKPVSDKSQVANIIRENHCREICMTVWHNEEMNDIQITPVKTGEQEYRLGIWIRDDTQGIGTITYVTKNGKFGTLGHGISDTDTGEIVVSNAGALYQADIFRIKKGDRENPGYLCGMIPYQEAAYLGVIEKNTETGIFGRLEEAESRIGQLEELPVGTLDQVSVGPAVLRCYLKEQWQDFDIQILQVDPLDETNKNMVIEVIDPDMLAITGGIVQGQSGSPIIQNGKLVGAVTHVFLGDPTRGYAIGIETMLKQSLREDRE